MNGAVPLHRDPDPAWQAPFLIEARRVFDGERMLGPRSVEIADGLIVALHEPGFAPSLLPVTRLPAACLLAPGFIDVQVNGGGGILLNDDPSVAAVRGIAQAHRRFGTTGLLPTLITDAPERLAALSETADAALSVPGVLGFHAEGPFLNPARKGIHPPQHVRMPSEADLVALERLGRVGRSFVTLAPERLDARLLDRLIAAGLRIAVGHSEATAEEVADAVDRGATGVTHLFNAMSQMMPRAPGVVGAGLVDERLFAGIICDGLHVDPVNLRAAFKAKGRDRLMLVTDAMPLIGSNETSFSLLGRPISLKDGRLTDAAGTLAGAHLSMIGAVRNAVTMMRVPLEDALVMASRTPATFLGLEREFGRILPGYRASLVAFDESAVQATWIDGRV